MERETCSRKFMFSFKCCRNTGITEKRIHLHETKAEAQSSPRTARRGGDGFGAGQMGPASKPGVTRLGQGRDWGGGVKQTNRNERGWRGEGQSSGRERGGERERDLYKKVTSITEKTKVGNLLNLG